MKKLLSSLLILGVIGLGVFTLPQQALAAWGASDTFNYSVGDLNGNNGGSGWSGPWSAGANFDVTATACPTGGTNNCVKGVASTDILATRTLTTASSIGTIEFYVKYGTNSIASQFVFLRNATPANVIRIGDPDTGNIQLTGATSVDIITGYSVDTWYVIQVDYRNDGGACSSTQVRARGKVDGGSFGSWTSCVEQSNTGDIVDIRFDQQDRGGTTAEYLAFDEISDQGAVAAATPIIETIYLWAEF